MTQFFCASNLSRKSINAAFPLATICIFEVNMREGK